MLYNNVNVPLIFRDNCCCTQLREIFLCISFGAQVPFSMMTFAVSLLLVFKTNSSYERWWEGRTVWGSVVNQMRNLTRQSLSYMTSPQDRPLQVT